MLLQKQNRFREQESRVQIFMASKNFYFDQQKLFFGLIVFFGKNATQYGIYFLPTSRHYRAVMSSQNRI